MYASEPPRLRVGFPLPGRADGRWGDPLAAFGVLRGNQVLLEGACCLAGLEVEATSLVGPRRGVVGTATYAVHTAPDIDAMEALLGPARAQQHPHRGRPNEVAASWTWDVGDEVTLTLSRYAAPRGSAVAGAILSCGHARLARPFLHELTAEAPWRQGGTVEPLGVDELEPCPLSDEALVLSRPGLVRPASWAREGLWEAGEAWGLADGAVTCVFDGSRPVELVLVRLLPARGPGGAHLEAGGVPVLESASHRGLDALAHRLEARGAVVTRVEHHDA